MSKENRLPKGESTQSAKFKDAARELGCDEDEAAFDEALKRIGSAPPPKDDKPKKDKPGQ